MTHETTFTNSQINSLQLTITTTSLNVPTNATNSNRFFIGVSLALLSSLFIGSSFILKKKGLLKLTTSNDYVRAGSGGYGYLCEIQWWMGLALMGLGEFCNFTAYGFAPASVVTPLGALSVLVSALMAVRFLDEKLNALGKIGCLLTIFGSIIIVIHAPKESEVNSLHEFARKLGALEFIFFSLLICITIMFLILYYGPRFGSKYVHIYILICSLLGAFTVTACKGLGVGIREIFSREHTFSRWLTFACLIMIIVCIIIQMIYLNRALDLFSTPIVTTVYYVLFTTCVLITSGILFREWHFLTLVDIFACLIGFSITTCGLILINYLSTNTLSNDVQAVHVNNDYFFHYFAASESSDSTSVLSVKQQRYTPIKSNANYLLDDGDLIVSTNSLNEQRQPMISFD